MNMKEQKGLTNDVSLIGDKENEKIANDVLPVQQTETYSNPTQNVIDDAVLELNPDENSMDSRG